MRVIVEDHQMDQDRTFEGSPQHVAQELMLSYPWARSEDPRENTVPALVELLDSQQMLSAAITDEDGLQKAETAGNLDREQVRPDSQIVYDMMGHNQKLADAFEAARFLSSRPTGLEPVRRAFWEHDGDPFKTALAAHGLEVSPENMTALRAFMELGLRKSEEDAVHASSVEAALPEGKATAEMIRRSFSDRFVVPVKLNGKHAGGTLLARDEATNITFLLKPGSGPQSPAAGAKDEGASQSRREACFYHIADDLGLGGFFPETDLLLIDGKEYAAMRLLPWSYKTLDWKREHGYSAPRILNHYLAEGSLHRWAVVDYILGNPDRHANNLMVGDGNEVVLIDHGSAFAGEDFDPANDQNSFIPFYLRAWASDAGPFNSLSADEKLDAMPRLNESRAKELGSWIVDLDAEKIKRRLIEYGIDPAPTLARLAKVKTMCLSVSPDLAINSLWTTT